ncbi:hypothetical protein EON81_25995, partial [bacterium]
TSNYIELMDESGEEITHWEPKYNGASLTPRFPRWTPDGQRLYFTSGGTGYYVTVSDPSTAVRVLTGVSVRIGISPDGTKLAFSRIPSGETDNEVFTSTLTGTSQVRVTTNSTNDYFYLWADDARVIVANPDADATRVYNLNGTVSFVYGNGYAGPIGRTIDGRYLFDGSGGAGYLYSIAEKDGLGYYSRSFLEGSEGLDIYQASISPDQKRWVVFEENRISTTEVLPQYRSVLRGSGVNSFEGGDWQPALGVTKFVGSGGKLGSTSAGIIATFRTNGNYGLSSFVNWDCETRANSNVSDDPTDVTAGTKTYVIEGGRLTALRYGNYPFFQNISTVSASGTASAAIVTVESQYGKVTNIVLYRETLNSKRSLKRVGDGKVIEGDILSVWDANGKNLAPSGASRVMIDKDGNATVG